MLDISQQQLESIIDKILPDLPVPNIYAQFYICFPLSAIETRLPEGIEQVIRMSMWDQAEKETQGIGSFPSCYRRWIFVRAEIQESRGGGPQLGFIFAAVKLTEDNMIDIEAWKEILTGIVLPNLPLAGGKIVYPLLFKSLPSHEEEGKVNRFLKTIEKEIEGVVKRTRHEDPHPRQWILSEEEDRFMLGCVRDPSATAVIEEEPEEIEPEPPGDPEPIPDDTQPGVYETGKTEE